jgi:hypothetical protein
MVAYARAHVIKNLSLKVEDMEYANQVTKATLTPDQTTQTLRVGVPDGTITDTDSAVWTFSLAGVQDFGSGSLGAALRTAAAAGTDLDVVYIPKNGTSQDQATFVLRPTQIPFGGEVGSFRTFDVDMPVVGQPTFAQSPSS